jgi:HK97 family phage major capsid protein
MPANGITMVGTVSTGFLSKLEQRRNEVFKACEGMLLEARSAGRNELNEGERQRYAHAKNELDGLDSHLAQVREDVARIGSYPDSGKLSRKLSSAGRLAPLGFDMEELRSAHGRIGRGESVVMEARNPGFVSADSLLPAQLYDIPTFPQHEDRLLDRLAGFALEAPSLEYVQVNSITGAAGIVGEGQLKPEVQMPATKLICTALKLAVHAGISWENWVDYSVFSQAVQNELMKQVIDLENAQLYGGDPTAGGLNSLTKTAGILTFAATGSTATPPNNFDDIAGGIARLRTGAALATPDLLLLHPDTWAAIRTQKDSLGRYISGNDPTDNQPETAWGVDVIQSTQFTAGEAVLVDSTLVGRVAVRETLVLRLGYSGTDFTENIIRVVCEERLNLAVERPAAICHITALPTAAPTGETTKAAKK